MVRSAHALFAGPHVGPVKATEVTAGGARAGDERERLLLDHGRLGHNKRGSLARCQRAPGNRESTLPSTLLNLDPVPYLVLVEHEARAKALYAGGERSLMAHLSGESETAIEHAQQDLPREVARLGRVPPPLKGAARYKLALIPIPSPHVHAPARVSVEHQLTAGCDQRRRHSHVPPCPVGTSSRGRKVNTFAPRKSSGIRGCRM